VILSLLFVPKFWYLCLTILTMSKTALVVEGGGTRGIYAAGALDVLGREGICFDAVIGVSAGAIHGCSFVSGQHGRSIRYYNAYLQDERFFGIKCFLKTGNIVGNDFCYHEIPEVLDPYDFEAFKVSPTKFYAVSSNIITGKPEYFLVEDMREEVDLLRASGSMPYCCDIVDWKGYHLLDGGCTDSIPLKAAIEMGYDKIIVIQTREEGYSKKPLNKFMNWLFYRKYPKFRHSLDIRHKMYNEELDLIQKMASEGKIIDIRPSSPLTISRLSRSLEELNYTYNLGETDCKAKLSQIKEYLSR